jgi:hypothetical protein
LELSLCVVSLTATIMNSKPNLQLALIKVQ